MKMKIESLKIEFNPIENINNGFAAIDAKLDDGITYSIYGYTPNFYYEVMNGKQCDYLPHPFPQIVVRSLTEENIKDALEPLLENNAVFLKIYHLLTNGQTDFDMLSLYRMISTSIHEKMQRESCEIMLLDRTLGIEYPF